MGNHERSWTEYGLGNDERYHDRIVEFGTFRSGAEHHVLLSHRSPEQRRNQLRLDPQLQDAVMTFLWIAMQMQRTGRPRRSTLKNGYGLAGFNPNLPARILQTPVP